MTTAIQTTRAKQKALLTAMHYQLTATDFNEEQVVDWLRGIMTTVSPEEGEVIEFCNTLIEILEA